MVLTEQMIKYSISNRTWTYFLIINKLQILLVKCLNLFTWMTSFLSCHHRADENKRQLRLLLDTQYIKVLPSVSEKDLFHKILLVLQPLSFSGVFSSEILLSYSQLLVKSRHQKPWKMMVSWPAWEKIWAARFLLQLLD